MQTDVRRTVTFQAPRTVEVMEEPVPEPDPNEVRVRTRRSAISPGTERLVYQGKAPSSLTADTDIEALSGALSFPLAYGYAAVGVVEICGSEVDDSWLGTRVFSFQPHTSHFCAAPDALIPLPEAASDRDGVMIPNLETAVNFLMDGRPMIGERVVVFGQGVVGLLTTSLLARHPVECLTVEPDPTRRRRSTEWGADRAFDVEEGGEALQAALDSEDGEPGADLVYELTGHPAVLDNAIDVAGYDGRVVVGSWYGTKSSPLHLGGQFHRSRIQLKSSQVSTIDPDHRGRWSKDRRMGVVTDLLGTIEPGALVSDVFDLREAPDVYRALDDGQDLLQPVFAFE